MRTRYSHCPNPDCTYHSTSPPPRWYWKRGYFRERVNGQLVPRYQCKKCRRSFSASTFKTTYRQKKPQINELLRRALAESVSIRGAVRELSVSKKTILRKLKFLGQLSEQVCREKREKGELKTNYVQFDELMAFERTQCLPLTVVLAVRPRTGEIITARVGVIPCETALKRRSRKKYGERKNEREQTVRAILKDVAQCVQDETAFTLASDSWLQYPDWVKQELPFAHFERHSGQDLKAREKAMATVDEKFDPQDFADSPTYGPLWVKKQKNGKVVQKAYDPLFHVNQKCMKLRASLSRLRRDFWGYTQKVENLQLHLWIFVALHNGYKLPKKRK